MSGPSLHVLSRGRTPENDYLWVAVEDGATRVERPPGLKDRAAHLVQSDSPSILIVRVGGELLLLCTALESSRSDMQGRPIRTAIALTQPESKQDILRSLAIQWLEPSTRTRLETTVDAAVKDTESGGFEVSAQLLEQLLGPTDGLEHEPPRAGRWAAPNDEDHRETLAQELRRCRLPALQGPLVVVTAALGIERLKEAGVWRGLTRLVHEPQALPSGEVRPQGKKGRATRPRPGVGILLLTAGALILLWTLGASQAFPVASGASWPGAAEVP